jgi:hypothetical protein
MNDEPTRLQRLRQQKAKLDQKIARTERKNDTRRKILIGACVDDMLKTGKGLNQIFTEQNFMARLDAFLTRDKDRALFNLAPKSGDEII